MTPQDARELVKQAVIEVAPDADLDAYGDEADLRDDLQFDSLDFLNFVEILSDRSGHRIEEDDYPNLATVEGCVHYLAGA